MNSAVFHQIQSSVTGDTDAKEVKLPDVNVESLFEEFGDSKVCVVVVICYNIIVILKTNILIFIVACYVSLHSPDAIMREDSELSLATN